MVRRAAILAVLAGVLVLAACGTDPGVRTQRADATGTAPVDTATATTDDTASTEPGGNDPTGTVDFGDDKPSRDYDDFVVAAFGDIQAWWAEQYPQVYGGTFQPLRGGIYAGYPQRATPIPGCGGDDETTYDELVVFAAFYCPDGDFMAYDDGDDGVLFDLAKQFGPSIFGVVLAHEYGHAIQQRAGVLDTDPATILTEQQADCFSGAWVARAARGEAPGIEFGDDDIRSGLIAIVTVRDPIGVDQFTPGGHGSGFDRVGAFQVGFTDGLARCTELIDDPLPLMPNAFTSLTANEDGNAPFGYGTDEIVGFTVTDLNAFWSTALGGGESIDALRVEPFDDPGQVTCDDVVGDPEVGALFCPSTDTVYLDEPLAQQRYGDYGDFAVAYMLSTAWSEEVQEAIGSPLQAEDRALLSDCLTGAWSQTLIPSDGGQARSATGVVIEPGDLDEAIQTALVVGDDSSGDDVLGSPFEKIASFRGGVIGSVDACRDLLPD